ncbi:hypothetical protein ACFYN3_01665 [Streptomyces lavendulae]|uniref:hypothetical protein n=1 Tax=Streptomyces lavendulae TaxID=1914 RepID=UPI0033D7207F
MTANPKVFINTAQRGFPAHLHLPPGVDCSPIVAEFEPGTFTWNERGQYAEFPTALSQAVVAVLFKHFTYVDMQYGRSEAEPEATTTVKRPAEARPSTWRQMGPRIPAAL